ncbi:hypothetical protein INT44_002742 [Umbelopsis vinacea]|uniref:Uncharacterized protein n=1 Tax=Umbelopsis vinacea TaxID=44442 RepID=A0A8H7Q6M9_9FUNG|nr:hypothetical protein INT44_002742 [Umbelopsis vinacea]
MELNNNDEYDTRALPSTIFIKPYLELFKPKQTLDRWNRTSYLQYLHSKAICAKMLLATSKLHVSITKCRQIFKRMIVENEETFKFFGLALNHVILEESDSPIGCKTWRMMRIHQWPSGSDQTEMRSRSFYYDSRKGDFDSPISWFRSGSMLGRNFLDIILLDIILKERSVENVRNESCRMKKEECSVTSYAKEMTCRLRMLMRSLLVEEGAALENLLELFQYSCAEAIATHCHASYRISQYAAFILESILSSGTYYLMDLASKCKDCPDCRLISISHKILYENTCEDGKAAYEDALRTSPLASTSDILLLSHDCDNDLDKLTATFDRPNNEPFVSHLRVADQALKCGDIRDILLAATLLASHRSLTGGKVSSGFFVGTALHLLDCHWSRFHGNDHSHPVSSCKVQRDVDRAIILAGNRDLMTLRVNETIFIFAVDRQRIDGTYQTLQKLQASDIVVDGKEMTELLKDIQIEGGSATYNKDGFGAIKSAVFTGDQKLWIPPLAEDLLQAGVYISRSRVNDDELGVINVIEQAALMEGKFSIRGQRKGAHIRKATRTMADIYQCSNEHTKLTSRMVTGVRIG